MDDRAETYGGASARIKLPDGPGLGGVRSSHALWTFGAEHSYRLRRTPSAGTTKTQTALAEVLCWTTRRGHAAPGLPPTPVARLTGRKATKIREKTRPTRCFAEAGEGPPQACLRADHRGRRVGIRGDDSPGRGGAKKEKKKTAEGKKQTPTSSSSGSGGRERGSGSTAWAKGTEKRPSGRCSPRPGDHALSPWRPADTSRRDVRRIGVAVDGSTAAVAGGCARLRGSRSSSGASLTVYRVVEPTRRPAGPERGRHRSGERAPQKTQARTLRSSTVCPLRKSQAGRTASSTFCSSGACDDGQLSRALLGEVSRRTRARGRLPRRRHPSQRSWSAAIAQRRRGSGTTEAETGHGVSPGAG